MNYEHSIYVRQVGLKTLDFYHGKLDGLNGPKTRAAYDASAKSLRQSTAPTSATPRTFSKSVAPPTPGNRSRVFGPAGVKGGNTPAMAYFKPPYPMQFTWGGAVARIGCHRLIAAPLKAALSELASFGPAWLRMHGLHLYAGCYNPRKSRGGSGMSDHAYAAAIDLNPAENGNHSLWPGAAKMPAKVVHVFRKHGFQVGFNKGAKRRDMMHVAYVNRD